MIPSKWINRNKNINAINEFQKWVNTSLSLENLLENILEIENLKKESKYLMEYFLNDPGLKVKGLNNTIKNIECFNENNQSLN